MCKCWECKQMESVSIWRSNPPFFGIVEGLHVCIQWEVGHKLLLLHSTNHHICHLLVQALTPPPTTTYQGEPLPLPGLTNILRALTFAGHLAHPHQSVEVALCSICDTWKHGSIGHQIKGARLKRLLQLCSRSLTTLRSHREASSGMGSKRAIGRNGDQAGKEKALWSNCGKQKAAKKCLYALANKRLAFSIYYKLIFSNSKCEINKKTLLSVSVYVWTSSPYHIKTLMLKPKQLNPRLIYNLDIIDGLKKKVKCRIFIFH